MVDSVLELLVAIELVLYSIIKLIKVQFEFGDNIPLSKAVRPTTDNIVDCLEYLEVGISRFRCCRWCNRPFLAFLRFCWWRILSLLLFQFNLSIRLLLDALFQLLYACIDWLYVGTSLCVYCLLLFWKFIDLSGKLFLLTDNSGFAFRWGNHSTSWRCLICSAGDTGASRWSCWSNSHFASRHNRNSTSLYR